MKHLSIFIIAAFAAFSAHAQTSHTPTMRTAVLKSTDAQPTLQRVKNAKPPKIHYFGTRLYAAAKRRGLSPEIAARAIGVTPETWDALVNDRTAFATIEANEKALDAIRSFPLPQE
jgi:hypothetical protein